MTDWNRIAKFAGMLGSDHDGEVINAARFLASELKKHGATFGDLAGRIGSGAPPNARERVEFVVRRVPENPAAAMARAALDAGTKLDYIERRFLESIIVSAAMTRGDYDLTPRQARWLMVLYDNRRKPTPKPSATKRPRLSDADCDAFMREFC